MNEQALYKLTYGLYVVTAKEDARDYGCIINTAMQVTAAPEQICICMNKGSRTHDAVKRTGRFALSVIGQEAAFSLFERFGFQSGRDVDKFAGFDDVLRTESGLYVITRQTNAYADVRVTQQADLGTHTLFTGRVEEAGVLSDVPSVTYTDYLERIKPKKKQKTEGTGKTGWQCTVCGYIYEGEELSEEYICPWCGHPAADFERVEL